MTVALGPAAGVRFAAKSAAVPLASDIPRVPFPVMLEIVTVRMLPLPATATMPVAEPVVFRITSAALKEMLSWPLYEMAYDTGPEAVAVVEGEPIESVGGVVSTTNVALGPAPSAVFPSVSLAVPGRMEIPSVPSPVRPVISTLRTLPLPPKTPTVPRAVPVEFIMMLEAVNVLD